MNRRVWYLVGLSLIILIVAVSAIVQSIALPDSFTITPGEKITLSVNFPLTMNLVKQEFLSIVKLGNIFRQNLTFHSSSSQSYEVKLVLFGKIPVKNLQIEVVDAPRVIPCGHAIGVLTSTQGVIVVGHLPVRGIDNKSYYPAKDIDLKVGDVILAIEGIPIRSVDDLDPFLEACTEDTLLHLTIKRQGQELQCSIKPVLARSGNSEKYMLGIFVEDPTAGVGTLSFYRPDKGYFAGLGHQISGSDGRNGASFQQGEIVLAHISGIQTGSPGKPGEKIGVFNILQKPIGIITRNCKFGIYGSLDINEFYGLSDIPQIPVAYRSQVQEGPATIYTVLDGTTVESFEVKITKVYKQNSPRDKGLIIEVTDPRLLRETGGIIQGMSGSPIIQSGRLVGAVTHVFVNDPTKGYGVLAEWMMQELEMAWSAEAS